MKHRKIFLVIICSIILFIGLSLLGGYAGHKIKYLAASILYCFVTYLFISRAKNRKEFILIIIILTLPLAVVYIPLHILDFQGTFLSFPSTLAQFIGIGFAIMLLHKSKKAVIVLSLFFIAASAWIAFVGYAKWIHKLNFNTWNENVSYKLPNPISGYDQFNNLITSDSFNNKFVLFDFWHTRCGVCFQKFPLLQNLFDKYKDLPNVKIYAIDKPLREDSANQAFSMLKNMHYTFPILMPDSVNLPEKFGVFAYPTVIIADKSSRVIFVGDIENAIITLDKLILNN